MKRLLILFLFFLSIPLTYSFSSWDLEIFTENEKLNLWEKTELIFRFKDAENLDFSKILENIEKTKWFENFEIIWPFQTYRSSSQSININWKIEEKKESIIELIYELNPKKVWNFEIWPFDFEENWEKFSKEKIKMEVLKKEEKEVKSEEFFEKKYYERDISSEENEKKYFFKEFIFLLVFFIIIFWIYFVFFRKKENEKILENTEENLKNKTENEDLETEEFVSDLEKRLKEKVIKKYNLENENKTFSEIISEIDDENERKKLKEISDTLDKIKYSDLDLK